MVGIAESHLTQNVIVDINGYKWIGNNRKLTHVRARAGSGGVGLLINHRFLEENRVETLDSEKDGILWVKFTNEISMESFLVCLVYLPPEFSSRTVNINDFMDILKGLNHSLQVFL